MQDYIHVHDYTATERQACWFHREDYAAMRAANTATLDKYYYGNSSMHHSFLVDEESESLLGLETQRTPLESMQCLQRIRTAIGAVLDEQDGQKRRGCDGCDDSYDGCYDGCWNDADANYYDNGHSHGHYYQQQQQQQYYLDSERLAARYSSYTWESRDRARWLGHAQSLVHSVAAA